MLFNRCGKSGLKLPAISLGLWHNFGFDKSPESKSAILPPGVQPRRHSFRSR
jgi:L-glyceraldehyde 3-phosphate reductase